MSEQAAPNEIFRVAKSENASECPCCNAPRDLWTVVWTEDDIEIEHHTSWPNREDAEELADSLNMAFEMGAATVTLLPGMGL